MPNRDSPRNRARRNTPEKFWAQVDRRGPDECWPWAGTVIAGYGRLRYRNLTEGTKNIVRAHQVAWCLFNERGLPSPGYTLHHKCENKICCNPSHMDLLTIGEHIHQHKGYGCKIHGYQEWRTQPSGQQKCGICNRARTAALTARKKASLVPSVGTTEEEE